MKVLGKSLAVLLISLPCSTLLSAVDSWTVEKLAYDLDTAEGPVWDAKGVLYFTEIFAHRVHEYTARTGELRTIRTESGGSNGMAFDADKRLLMCEMLGRRVSRMEPDGSITPLWDAQEPGRGGPNDVVVSKAGNAYFTMPRHQTVYRVEREGLISPFISELPGINGVMLSKDERTLYVTEYRNRRVLAFSLDDAAGEVGQKRVFAEIQTDGDEHGADGMAVDADNRLYVTCLGGVWIYDERGAEVGVIPLPGEKVTNCAFGGESMRTLYITTQKGLFQATRQAAGER